MPRFWRTTCALSAAAAILPQVAAAQNATLPTITVESARPAPTARPRPAPAQAGSGTPSTAQPVPGAASANQSLTVQTTEQARQELNQSLGAVAIVPAEQLRDRNVSTIKDILDYVPGVWAQPKWGEDTRLSIRGSGLSRNFHGRSLQLYMDGVIPINTADGYFDFQEIDPTAYRYTEVWRGASALRFGANSLGGAINFVTPSGRDARPFAMSADVGSFGYRRIQSSSGAASGPFDYFVTGSYQVQDGFREHSNGNLMRGSANVGYKITPDIETRFYFNGNTIEQRIPGAVTKNSALTDPQTAQRINVVNDWQRNINSNRFANKTAIRLGENTLVEVGAFNANRHLMHPIFQWLDYTYDDYGGFGRVVDDRTIYGFRNRLVAGINIHNGDNDNQQFATSALAIKGILLSSSLDKSRNSSAYAENSFYFLPTVAACRTATSPAKPISRSGARNSASCGTSIRPRRSTPISRAAPKSRASARVSRRSRSLRRTCRPFRSPTSRRSARPPTRSAPAASGRIIHGTSRCTGPRSRTSCNASTACSAIAM
jgi:iron complex outermembrane receptor protein